LCFVVLSGLTPAPCESDAVQPLYLLCGFGADWVCVDAELELEDELDCVDELEEDEDEDEDVEASCFCSCPGGVPCGLPANATPVRTASDRQAAPATVTPQTRRFIWSSPL
jgi:hypothetical protein